MKDQNKGSDVVFANLLMLKSFQQLRDDAEMSFFTKWLRRKPETDPSDLAKPYVLKARRELLNQELPKAIAYLERGMELAPEDLSLYLQRAQILQYGIEDCAAALRDYRYILRVLETRPDPELAEKCRQGMKDMMSPSSN
jgi:tetratricopeptide (TPR) repeat protein